jgi:hypothetical protein
MLPGNGIWVPLAIHGKPLCSVLVLEVHLQVSPEHVLRGPDFHFVSQAQVRERQAASTFDANTKLCCRQQGVIQADYYATRVRYHTAANTPVYGTSKPS